MAKNQAEQQKSLARISPIHHLVFQLCQLVALPLSTTATNIIKKAKDGLAGHFEFCLHTLQGRANRRMPLGDVTNDARRKVGPKTSAERAEHN